MDLPRPTQLTCIGTATSTSICEKERREARSGRGNNPVVLAPITVAIARAARVYITYAKNLFAFFTLNDMPGKILAST